jgi:endonuclease/exonuclease/phosphatase family metal-dependent hydrolase
MRFQGNLCVAVLLIASASATFAQQSASLGPNRLVRVMTQNVYHGVDAEIFAVPTATSQADLLNKVAAVYNGYLARNFPERAAALALEIDATRPDLIGLQEAILVRTQQPADGAVTPATHVQLNYVQILLDALAARGLAYKVVIQSVGFDLEPPSGLGFDVRHTDREVILARADVKAADLTLSNPLAANFAVSCEIPTGFGTIPIRRGWVSVDARVRGRSFRFLSTHLDGDCLPFTTAIQQAQSAELLAGPAATDLPVVLVADLNSPADGTGVTYNTLTGAAGFTDTWTASGIGVGLTCCQADDLRNSSSSLTQRIDFVLFRGPFTPLAAITVGDQRVFKTPSGMWPSDHAGIVAALLPRP